MNERLSKEDAVEKLMDAQHGVLMTIELDPVPVIGKLEANEYRFRATQKVYRFPEVEPDE